MRKKVDLKFARRAWNARTQRLLSRIKRDDLQPWKATTFMLSKFNSQHTLGRRINNKISCEAFIQTSGRYRIVQGFYSIRAESISKQGSHCNDNCIVRKWFLILCHKLERQWEWPFAITALSFFFFSLLVLVWTNSFNEVERQRDKVASLYLDTRAVDTRHRLAGGIGRL